MISTIENDILYTSAVTADVLVEESRSSMAERAYNKKVTKLERRKKKLALERYMKRVARKKTSNSKRKKGKTGGEMVGQGSIRTHHEEIFESYLKLLGQPFLINQLFCFSCNNFYTYGDHMLPPKKCQVCQCIFTVNGINKKPEASPNYLSRPDFLIDYNSEEDRMRYRHDTHHHRLTALKGYHNEYMKKVSVVRIDGSIHQKHSQQKKDYHQYHSYRDSGVKVFIVQNQDIDDLLNKNDNGKAMLKLCQYIGECTINAELYDDYVRSGDFSERTKRPF